MGGKGSGGHNKKSIEQHRLEGTYRPGRHGPGAKTKRRGPQRRAPASHLEPKADPFSRPDGYLVFMGGWTFNEPTPAHAHERGPFFDSIADMRNYYLANRDRVLEEVGVECWAFHAFECESPDCPRCAFFREAGYFEALDGRKDDQ